ncbi:ABC transporter permease [Catenulispora sp. GP43]|uniref:ABC transporter permease n=1 Tax=Catenulispora sp. GP43 TaxID=3156263 RepID=UPI003512F202
MLQKELRVLLADRGAMITLFLSPIMFITVMSLALGSSFANLGSSGKLSICVVDQDGGTAARSLFSALTSTGELRVTSQTEAQSQVRVKAGTDAFAVVIPAGFEQQIESGAAPSVRYVVDPSAVRQVVDPLESAINGVVLAVGAQTRTDLALNRLAGSQSDPAVKSAVAEITGLDRAAHTVDATTALPSGSTAVKYPTVYQQNVPGYAVMYVFFIVTVMAGSILAERREGTFRRLLSSPMPRWQLLLGKVAPYLLVALVQVGVLLAFGRLVFGMGLGAHPLALLPLSAALACCAAALGLLLASFSRTEAQVNGMGTVVVLVLAALGGCMVPGVFMPQFMRDIADYVPQGIALNGYQDVLVRGDGLASVLPASGVLLAVAAGLFLLAVPRFRFVR